MKAIKINKEEIKINREAIKKFGEFVYNSPEVESIGIKVNFKDGSSIGFKRDENEDDFDRLFEKGDE